MTVYVLLEMEDEDAKTLAEDMLKYPESRILTPAMENDIESTLCAVFKKPTIFCNCQVTGAAKGRGKFAYTFTRGKKYGWWVHSVCGKPMELACSWPTKWNASLGFNLIPPELCPAPFNLEGEGDPRFTIRSPVEWSFLTEKSESSLVTSHE